MDITMYDYIKETPSVCKGILDKRKQISESFVKSMAANRITRIILIASGSSRNAATAARLFMEKYLQIPVNIVTPLSFMYYEHFYDENDLIMAISESGRSLTTISAVQKVISKGFRCMVLTNNLDSPIASTSSDIISLACGPEKVGYVTKGYTSTILDLMLFALESALALKRISAEEYDNVIREISSAVGKMNETVESAETWYHNNRDQFIQCKRVMVIGYGPNFGTALEGALKMEETIGLPSNPFELEDFMHGPNLELTKESTVFFINTKSFLEKKMLSLKEFVDNITDRSFLITHEKTNDKKTLSISHGLEETVSPLLLAIPFQVVAFLTCGDLGINLKLDRPADSIFKLSKINP